MNDREDKIDHHTAELVRLTMTALNAEPPLPENDLARLGAVIALERQMLIDEVHLFLEESEPEAAERPGVAEFDAGFRYGLEFGRVLDETRQAMERVRRKNVLKMVR